MVHGAWLVSYRVLFLNICKMADFNVDIKNPELLYLIPICFLCQLVIRNEDFHMKVIIMSTEL